MPVVKLRRSRLLLGLGLVVAVVAGCAIWVNFRINQYDSRQGRVLRVYESGYSTCVSGGGAPASCSSSMGGRCTEDPFWQRNPPFSWITQDDAVSDGSTLCQFGNQ
jgi:hypothetical protein